MGSFLLWSNNKQLYPCFYLRDTKGLSAPCLPSKLQDWPLLLSLVSPYVESSLEGSGLKIARFGGEGMRGDSVCFGVWKESPQNTGDVYIESARGTATPSSPRPPSWERTRKPGTPPSTHPVPTCITELSLP